MYADPQTREDLEVFRATGTGRSLVDLVDRCQTPGGRRRLRERLGSPSSDRTVLARWFDAVSWLARQHAERKPDALLPTIPSHAVEAFSRYLDHPLSTTGDRSLQMGQIETLWITLRDPELVELAEGGHVSLHEILEGVLPLARRLCDPSGSAPSALRVVGESLLGLEAKLGLQKGVAEARSRMRLLALDDHLRRRHRGDLLRLLSLVAELDVYLGLAELVHEGWAVPALKPAEAEGSSRRRCLTLSAAWHPSLPDGVRNDWTLGDGAPVQLLTGPNMAGKTTALRVLGTCTWLAHCGLPVPAEAMVFAPLGTLHVTLHPRDDLAAGVSLFLAEILRVRAFLESVTGGTPTLGIFDELFRGTNPTDAREATRRVVCALARSRNASLVLSTHLSELVDELTDVPGSAALSLTGQVGKAGLIFDFRIRSGVSHQRLGLSLLDHYGIDLLLTQIDRAQGA